MKIFGWKHLNERTNTHVQFSGTVSVIVYAYVIFLLSSVTLSDNYNCPKCRCTFRWIYTIFCSMLDNKPCCRLNAQALTLAALAGAAVVEYYDHKASEKKVDKYANQFLTHSQKD